MSSVKGRDNPLEKRVRAALHRHGFRFRTHVRTLPGRPDIVLPKFQTAIFVDGDFWHGFNFPRWRHKLSPFWQIKIEANRNRDARNFRRLRRSNWAVIRLWQHQLDADFDRCIEHVIEALTTRAVSVRGQLDLMSMHSAAAGRQAGTRS
jgi:DNA mismatch endonuclease, patch repair protein